MTSAKLFILGEERELLWTDTNYYRRIDSYYGSPCSDIEGGLIMLSFVSQEDDDVFCHNMLKEVEDETERMEKGEIHFFTKGDEDIPVKKYKFNDAYLVHFTEVFYADVEGTNNMRIILTISPAIQSYAPTVELVKWWNKSWVPPAEPSYYVRPEEEEDQFIDISGYFYTKEGKYLGKIGTSNNVYITDDFSFSELEKRKNVSKEKIINFTAKSDLNNDQFLNRANWVFGEGGGVFADRYAMTIKNLRLTGRSGYGLKPFSSDEEMYKRTMSHGDPPKTLYPEYLNGTYKGHNAQAFALAKRNLTDLNKNSKMGLAIKEIINSFAIEAKNEKYVAWRGSGDKLYSESEKEIEHKKSGKIEKEERFRKDGKVYGSVCNQKDHYWETVGSKYRRHTFIKIWFEKK